MSDINKTAFQLDVERKLMDREFLEPPDYLTEEQKFIWDKLVHSLPPGFYVKTDEVLLFSLVKTLLRIEEAEIKLENEGYVIVEEERSKPSPWISILNSQNLLMLRLCEKLKLTPSFRQGAEGGELKKNLMKKGMKPDEEEDSRRSLC